MVLRPSTEPVPHTIIRAQRQGDGRHSGCFHCNSLEKIQDIVTVGCNGARQIVRRGLTVFYLARNLIVLYQLILVPSFLYIGGGFQYTLQYIDLSLIYVRLIQLPWWVMEVGGWHSEMTTTTDSLIVQSWQRQHEGGPLWPGGYFHWIWKRHNYHWWTPSLEIHRIPQGKSWGYWVTCILPRLAFLNSNTRLWKSACTCLNLVPDGSAWRFYDNYLPIPL